MKQHDFIPLLTFRGYSDIERTFIYGQLVLIDDIYAGKCPYIYENEREYSFEVCKDSIGIYTGKDDKNGTPIFCGVDGAKHGSDVVSASKSKYEVYFRNGKFMLKRSVFFSSISESDVEVIGNQYEQHLKEQKCSK